MLGVGDRNAARGGTRACTAAAAETATPSRCRAALGPSTGAAPTTCREAAQGVRPDAAEALPAIATLNRVFV